MEAGWGDGGRLGRWRQAGVIEGGVDEEGRVGDESREHRGRETRIRQGKSKVKRDRKTDKDVR